MDCVETDYDETIFTKHVALLLGLIWPKHS